MKNFEIYFEEIDALNEWRAAYSQCTICAGYNRDDAIRTFLKEHIGCYIIEVVELGY